MIGPFSGLSGEAFDRERPVLIQEADSLKADSLEGDEKEKGPDDFLWRPTIGPSVGMLTFYGDVGRNHRFYHPTVSRVGYQFRISGELTRSLEMGFSVLRGKLGANERSLDRNLNFESTITAGGIDLAFNFAPLLPEDPKLSPYLSVGVEAFEFLSKTDLYNGDGERYHYWDDGTIRNKAEDGPNAEQAEIISRDYVYETDLRELNLDGFGEYDEYSFATPVGAGFELHLTEGVDFRIGSRLHYTFTDLIDNLSYRGEGVREGDKQHDKFLFTSFSVQYRIPFGEEPPRKKEPEKEGERELLAADTDEDGDGVPDLKDSCLATPENVMVAENGCAKDTDGDGIPDYRDNEIETPEDKVRRVDSLGVAMTDDQFLESYERYMDSVGKYVTIKDTIYDRVESIRGPLKAPDKEKAGKKEEVEKDSATPKGIVFHVQVGAFQDKVNKGAFDQVPELLLKKSDDGTYRYFSGNFEDFKGAAERKKELLQKGKKGAFITAYKDGERVPLSDLNVDYRGTGLRGGKMDGGGATAPEKDGSGDVAETSGPAELSRPIDKDAMKFRVQVGAYENEIPIKRFKKYMELGNVQSKSHDGLNKYLLGEYSSYQAAVDAKEKVAEKGLEGAFVVGSYKERLIPADKARELLQKGD